MENVSFADYQKWPQINGSLLTHAWKSWKQFKHVRQFGYQPKTGTRVGSSLHSLVECFPLDNFDHLFTTMPDYKSSPDNMTSTGKPSSSATSWVREQETAFRDANSGQEVLSIAEHNRCRRMIHAISENVEASSLITSSLREACLTTELHEVACKGRLDGVRVDDDCFWDLKTTRDVSAHGFGKTAANLRYVFKMAFYWRLLQQNGIEATSVKFIAVQDSIPLGDGSFNEAADCTVYEIPMIALENQFSEIERLLTEYKHCLATDTWPGVKDDDLYIPNWSMNEIELV